MLPGRSGRPGMRLSAARARRKPQRRSFHRAPMRAYFLKYFTLRHSDFAELVLSVPYTPYLK
jgi:hypothetical protein